MSINQSVANNVLFACLCFVFNPYLDPRTRVLWWHTQNFTDTRSVGSNRYLHLQYVDVSDKGIYYCTDEHTNYDQAHSVTTLVVLQRSQFGYVSNAIVVKFDEKSDASFTCPIYSVPGSKVSINT
uniref:Ig-like domain-containing protein n=1 Tax=Heterorhabditis bacteriophora TaxID=37862 RepID=A0A1I7WE06_HETBA